MNTVTENRILIKIFVGFEITIDIRMHLNQSTEWKKASVVKDQSHIIEIRFNEKHYIGRHLDAKMPTLKDIQTQAAQIRERLQEFCPEINVDALKINIFPQVFVS